MLQLLARMTQTAAATTTAAAALEVTRALLQGGGSGEEEQEKEERLEIDGGGAVSAVERKHHPPPPKKRAVLLTAFIACISFLIFLANILSSLFTDFLENDRVWNHLGLWINATMPKCGRNKTFPRL